MKRTESCRRSPALPTAAGVLALMLALTGCSSPAGGDGTGNPTTGSQLEDTPADGDLPDGGNRTVFTVYEGSYSWEYSWDARYPTVGFSFESSYGNYYNFFAASDGRYDDLTWNFFSYLMIYVPSLSVGDYSSGLGGGTDIRYHDRFGVEFTVDDDIQGTFAEVSITAAANGTIRGTYDCVLYSYYLGKTIRIVGSFVSFPW